MWCSATTPRSAELGTSSDEDRLAALYRLALGRGPTPAEQRQALAFIESAGDAPPRVVEWNYGYGEVAEDGQSVASYHALPHWTGKGWQGGPEMPDPKLRYVQWHATSGHPGDPSHAAILRWTAPCDGVVSVSGTLEHGSDQGDGVRARLFGAADGALSEWIAQHGKTSTEREGIRVERGAHLYFVVDCRGATSFDAFSWAPQVKLEEAAEGSMQPLGRVWDARNEFHGPDAAQLTVWDMLAQVLMLTNEFAFVD